MFENFYNFLEQKIIVVYALIVLGFSFLTYFSNYQYPNASVWDEVYHVSSGEKYLEGTLFMEAHPPLGKLFIGLGEKLVNVNDSYDKLNPAAKVCLAGTPSTPKYKDKSGAEQEYKISENSKNGQTTRDPNLLEMRQMLFEKGILGGPIDKGGFTKTDSISTYPDHFSFCGFRLFPVLFAVFTAPLFFILLWLLIRNTHLAFIFSSLYVFDNALIVQARAAMLDTFQIFFIVGALAFLVYAINRFNAKKDSIRKISWWQYGFLGVLIGLITVTKHNGAILVVLPLIWALYEATQNTYKFDPKKILPSLQPFGIIAAKVAYSMLLAIFVYCSVFFIHFSLGKTIVNDNSNNNGKYFLGKNLNAADNSDKITKVKAWAQRQYLQALEKGQTANPKYFLAEMITNEVYMEEYHAGVPKLDLTKSNENGSYPTNWPVMNRTISYRWETADGDAYRYTYLIGNPVIWFFGLIGMLLAMCLVVSHFFFDIRIKDKRIFGWIGVFAFLYAIYMAAMLQTIQIRVMYLYHYFIPLIFSLILFVLVVKYLIDDGLESEELDITFSNRPFRIYGTLVVMVFLIALSFAFYSPLAYYTPLTNAQFEMRNLFDFWQMKTANGSEERRGTFRRKVALETPARVKQV